MYLHLSKTVSVKHKISFFIKSAPLNMSSECLLRDLVFSNAVVSVSLLAFGNDNGDSKHSLDKRALVHVFQFKYPTHCHIHLTLIKTFLPLKFITYCAIT